jgi:HK97 family phage portal protein
MRIFARLKSAASDFLQGFIPRNVLQIMASHGSRPSTKRNELLKHFTSWGYICPQRNATAVSEVPLRLYAVRRKGEQPAGAKYGHPVGRPATKQQVEWLGKNRAIAESQAFKEAVDVEEIIDHPLLDLIRRPNPWMTSFETRSLTSVYLDMTGDGFWWIPPGPLAEGDLTRPDTLWVLPTQAVSIVPDKDGAGLIKAYKYGRGTIEKPKLIPPRDMVHHRFPNPLNPLQGYAPAEAVLLSMVWDESMDIYENALNKNMARPEGVLTFEQDVTEAQRKSLQADINSTHRGVFNVGKMVVGGKNAQWKPLSWSPKEMAAMRGRDAVMKKISNAFGVPLALIETKDVNRANADAAMVVYQRWTILPRLRLGEEKLNIDLVPKWDDTGRLFFAYDNPVPEDREFMLKKEESRLNTYTVTVNEVRTKDGLDPVEWGDTPLVPVNVAPLGSAPPENQATGEATRMLSPKTVHSHSGSSGGCGCCSDEWVHVKQDGEAELRRTGGPNAAMTPNERKLKRVVDEVIDAQEADAIQQPPVVIDIDSQKYADDFLPAALPILSAIALRSGNAAQRASGLPAAPWFEGSTVRSNIRADALKFLKSIGDETQQGLADTINAGLADGEGPFDLTKRVREFFRGTERAKRAEMIARTESIRAETRGQIAAWKESGVVNAKIWDSLDDACPFLPKDGRASGSD